MNPNGIIRQSGGAAILTIPKAVLTEMNIGYGSKVGFTVEGNRLVINPVEDSLEALLAASPKENFRMTDEDNEWVNSNIGREAL